MAVPSRRPVAQFLERHASAEARSPTLAELPPREHVIVIPALGEDVACVDRLPAPGRGYVVLVVNARERDGEAHAQNAELLAALRSARQRPLGEGVELCQRSGHDVLLVDRASPGRRLGPRQGVGTARRIGSDIAFALHVHGRVSSRWIHWTDADASLDPDHFSVAPQARGPVALSYQFRHQPSGDDAVDRAHADYEAYLRYYVLGLRWAGSPYAHHAIGSTLACDALAYAQVRGVPPRRAGEDFYLLNKLAKEGPVATPPHAVVTLAARSSQRTPFGTGAAVAKLAGGESLEVYHPGCFLALREVLAMLADGWRESTTLSPLAAAAAAELAIPEAVTAAQGQVPAHRLAARLTRWFDAFRTLKLMHALRDGVGAIAGKGTLPLGEALAAAAFLPTELPSEPWARCRALAALERPTLVTGARDESPL